VKTKSNEISSSREKVSARGQRNDKSQRGIAHKKQKKKKKNGQEKQSHVPFQ